MACSLPSRGCYASDKESSPIRCAKEQLAEASGSEWYSVRIPEVMLTTGDDSSITVTRSDGKMCSHKRRTARRIQVKRWTIEVQRERDTIRHSVSAVGGTPVVLVVLITCISFSQEDNTGIGLRGQKLLCLFLHRTFQLVGVWSRFLSRGEPGTTFL